MSRSGLWPVVAGRLTATLALVPLAVASRVRPGPGGGSLSARDRLLAAGPGAVAAVALTCYLLATRRELLVVAVVLSSLYPAIPVLLGVVALRERLSWRQVLGLTGAAAAVTLLTLG